MEISLSSLSELITLGIGAASFVVTHFVYKMDKRFSKIENMMAKLTDTQEDIVIQQRELQKQIQHQNEVMAKLEGQMARMNGHK